MTIEHSERRLLIRGGRVVTMDDALGDLPVGDVLVVGDRIIDVSPRIDAAVDEVIEATGMMVFPGLIDTHAHMWQTPLRGFTGPLWSKEYFQIVHPLASWFDADAIGTAAELGALEFLHRGVTTVVDYCHAVNSPEHAEESLRAYRVAGIRAVFGYSLLMRDGHTFRDRAHQLAVLGQLAARHQGPTALQQVWMAVEDPFVEKLQISRDMNLPVMIHGAPTGVITSVDEAGLLAQGQLWAHCNQVTDAEFLRLADVGAAVSFTPDVEVGMGKPIAMFRRARACGVPVTYGIDVPSYVRNDLLAQLRLALQIHRALDGQAEREGGRVPPVRQAGVPQVSSRDLLASATIVAARALGMGEVTGSLTPGKQADVIVVDAPFGLSVGDPAEHLLLYSESADVDTVLVAGAVRKRAGRLVGVESRSLIERFEKLRQQVLGPDPNAVLEHALVQLATATPAEGGAQRSRPAFLPTSRAHFVTGSS